MKDEFDKILNNPVKLGDLEVGEIGYYYYNGNIFTFKVAAKHKKCYYGYCASNRQKNLDISNIEDKGHIWIEVFGASPIFRFLQKRDNKIVYRTIKEAENNETVDIIKRNIK